MTWRKTRTTNSGKVRHTGLYRDPDGNERSAGTFSRAKDADAAAAAQEALVKTGQWVDPDLVIEAKPIPTFRWYVENAWWPNRRLELSTRATYDQMLRLYLLPRFGETLLPDIVRSDVQSWLTVLEGRQEAEAVLRGSVLQAAADYPRGEDWSQCRSRWLSRAQPLRGGRSRHHPSATGQRHHASRQRRDHRGGPSASGRTW